MQWVSHLPVVRLGADLGPISLHVEKHCQGIHHMPGTPGKRSLSGGATHIWGCSSPAAVQVPV